VAFFKDISKLVSLFANKNSSNENGYIKTDRTLPTPKEGISAKANSNKDPAAIRCKLGIFSKKYLREEMAGTQV
jgi:hypothetical protein